MASAYAAQGGMVPGLTLGKLYANSMLVLLNNRFTILEGRNTPHLDFDIASYHRSDLADANAGTVLSHGVAFAHSHPEVLSGGEGRAIELVNIRQEPSKEAVGGKKADV